MDTESMHVRLVADMGLRTFLDRKYSSVITARMKWVMIQVCESYPKCRFTKCKLTISRVLVQKIQKINGNKLILHIWLHGKKQKNAWIIIKKVNNRETYGHWMTKKQLKMSKQFYS